MRRIFALCLALVFVALPTQAQDALTIEDAAGAVYSKVIFDWTSAADGTATGRTTAVIPGIMFGVALSPSLTATQPTDLYDVDIVQNFTNAAGTIVEVGTDVLVGALDNQSNSTDTFQTFWPANIYNVGGFLSIKITNAGDSKEGRVELYVYRQIVRERGGGGVLPLGPATAEILQGDTTTGGAKWVAVSGDATIADGGVVTVTGGGATTEAALEANLSDVTNVFTNNDTNILDVNVDNDLTIQTTKPITTTSTVDGIDIATAHALIDSLLDFFNGTIIETFDATVASDGAVITLSLEKTGGGDLTLNFSDGQTTFDCTPAATLTITPGADTTPVARYIYILQSTNALTEGTSWPAAEHAKIAYLLVPSATRVNTLGGTYVNQNWNDHAQGSVSNQGHLTDLATRHRRSGAIWVSGALGTATVDVAETPDAIWVSMAAGVISQMHDHIFAALDSDTAGADDSLTIFNHNTTAYTDIDGLHEITEDSAGASIGTNKYFSVVLWAAMNKTGEPTLMLLNLPSGVYGSLAGAQGDSNHYADYSIPVEYNLESSTGFLVAEFIIKKGASDYTLEDTIDLRGRKPETHGGSGSVGDVTSAAVLVATAVVVGDDGAKGIKDTNVLIDSSDDVTGMNSLALVIGATIDEFSIDGALAGNSDTALPTEQAVKTYVDSFGPGDVTAASNITDTAIVIGDGGAKGVKTTAILVDASDNVSAINDLDMTGDLTTQGTVTLDNTSPPAVLFNRNLASVTFNATLGNIDCRTNDSDIGTAVKVSGIFFKAEETFTSGNAATGIAFLTSDDGSGTVVEALRIKGNGLVTPLLGMTVTGDATFNDDVFGSPVVFTMGHAATITLNSGNVDDYLEVHGVTMTSAKGIVVERSGSVVGLTMMYDVTATTDPSGYTVSIDVLINGSEVWTGALSEGVSTGIRFNSTQARGLDTFSASDDLAVRIGSAGMSASESYSIDDMIVTLRVYYD